MALKEYKPGTALGEKGDKVKRALKEYKPATAFSGVIGRTFDPARSAPSN